MCDTITGFVHLDKIADEIGDEAGTCDADYAFQRAAAQMIYDLRNALEQAEARAEKPEKELAGADAEIAELRDELEDSRGTEKDAPNVLCAIARLAGVFEHCQEIGDDMGEMTLDAVRDLLAEKQKSEAENARLTKERKWLAQRCAMHCHDKDRDDILCSNDTCDIQTCWGASGDEWERSARRAVAAGEE